jgi:hypothetical protein
MSEPGVIAQFDKCPHCGSAKRLGAVILERAKAKGAVPAAFEWYPMQMQLPPPVDPLKLPLIGSMVPTAFIFSDFCLGCGRNYVVKIVEASAEIQNYGPVRTG